MGNNVDRTNTMEAVSILVLIKPRNLNLSSMCFQGSFKFGSWWILGESCGGVLMRPSIKMMY